jgi:hypothetical protein
MGNMGSNKNTTVKYNFILKYFSIENKEQICTRSHEEKIT